MSNFKTSSRFFVLTDSVSNSSHEKKKYIILDSIKQIPIMTFKSFGNDKNSFVFQVDFYGQ